MLVIITNNRKEQVELVTQFRIEQEILTTLGSYHSEELSYDKLRKTFIGFGLYSASGDALLRYGTAPEHRRDYVGPTDKLQIDTGKGTFTIMRSLNPAASILTKEAIRGAGIFPKDPSAVRYIYSQLMPRLYFKDIRSNKILAGAGLVVIVTTVIGFFILFVRIRNYKQRLNRQENLVILGGAARTIAHEI